MKGAGKFNCKIHSSIRVTRPDLFFLVDLTMQGIIKADRNIGKGLYSPQHLHAFKVFFYWRQTATTAEMDKGQKDIFLTSF